MGRNGDRKEQSWGADLRRSALYGLGTTALTTLLLLGAATGLMRHENTGEVIRADATWAGVLAAGGGMIWAFTQLTPSGPGRRHRRSAAPVVLSVFVTAGIDLVAMCLWPLIVGNRADPGDVLALYPTDPQAFAVLALFVLGMHAAFAAIVLGFAPSTLPTGLLLALVFLAVIGLGFWQGVTILDNPPNAVSLAVWAVAAVVAVGAVAAVAAFTGPRDRRRTQHG